MIKLSHLFLIILLLGVILRLYDLSGESIWIDEGRSYSLATPLILVSSLSLINFVQKQIISSTISYILSTSVLLYTHALGIPFVLAQNIYIIRTKQQEKKFILCSGWFFHTAATGKDYYLQLYRRILKFSPTGCTRVTAITRIVPIPV